jgi:hypothetical protein
MGGVKENDYAMILGYPGRTNRWLPAGGIEQNVKFAYPAWVEGAKTGMDNMKKYMDQSAALRLVYASKFAGTANYWKNRQGMIDALSKFETAKSKAVQEAKFDKWAQKPANKAKYGTVVKNINAFYAMTNEKARHDNYLQQLLRTTFFGTISRSMGRQLDAYVKADAAKRAQLAPGILEMAGEMYKEMYLPAEKDLLAAQLNLYAAKSTGYAVAPMVEKLAKENGGDFTKYAHASIDLSLYSSFDKVKAFLDAPAQGLLDNDPLQVLSADLLAHLSSKSDAIAKVAAEKQRVINEQKKLEQAQKLTQAVQRQETGQNAIPGATPKGAGNALTKAQQEYRNLSGVVGTNAAMRRMQLLREHPELAS